MANTQKREFVEQLIDILKNNNFALVKFDQTPHKQLEDLRGKLIDSDAHFSVVKNSLFEKAVNKIAQTDETFRALSKDFFPIEENSALLILSEDYIGGLKIFFEASKDNETFAFKFGYVDSQTYGGQDLTKIAQLPGREELLAKIIGSMKSPIARTTRAMTANMQKLVFVMKSKAESKTS
ncbi:50S ribosomal protein L10 [Candidatus Woesebacteria bacterium]|nr:50S ribosomal protein L10 [Candidatus Woesebacteria bacterium]